MNVRYFRNIFFFIFPHEVKANSFVINGNKELSFFYITLVLSFIVNAQKYVYVRPGNTVELQCQNKSTTNDITWFGPQVVSPISKGCTIHWNSANGRVSITKGYNLRISGVKESDIGKYKCIVTTGKISYQHDLNLILERPPKNLRITNANADNIITGTEEKELTLQCNVESGTPRGSLVWIHNRKILQQSKSGLLNYTFVLKKTHHLSQYTCKTISSTVDVPLSQTVTVRVLYAPRVYLKKNESQMIITEGQPLTIRCYAEGIPEPNNFTWKKRTNLISTLSTLYIDVVKRTDADRYTCTASNLIGTGNVEVDVVVFYPPTVEIKYINYTSDVTFKMLTCIANGIPETYTFSKWEHKSDYGDHIRFLSGNTNGSLILPNDSVNETDYQNNGFYRCTVSNGIPDINGLTKQYSDILLDVKGKPVFIYDNADAIYGEYHMSASIVVNIYSNPKYTALEIFDKHGHRVTSGTNVKIIVEYRSVLASFHGSIVHVKGYRVTLNLERLTQEYFTEYTFRAINDFGHSDHKTSVIIASSPAIPLNVTIFPTTNGIWIRWIRNFNGGLNQTFFIDYRRKDRDNWKTIQAKNFTNFDRISWAIPNLHPGNTYVFRMFSQNVIGDSNKTEEITIQIPVKTKDGSLFLIVVTGSASVCIILLIAIAIYLIKRSSCTQLKTEVHHCTRQTNNIECGPYDEIDEHQMEDNLGSNNETETVIDSEYELPCNLLPNNRDSDDNQKSISSSSSVKSEEIDENETLAKDFCINSYEQLTDNREQPLPYDLTS